MVRHFARNLPGDGPELDASRIRRLVGIRHDRERCGDRTPNCTQRTMRRGGFRSGVLAGDRIRVNRMVTAVTPSQLIVRNGLVRGVAYQGVTNQRPGMQQHTKERQDRNHVPNAAQNPLRSLKLLVRFELRFQGAVSCWAGRCC